MRDLLIIIALSGAAAGLWYTYDHWNNQPCGSNDGQSASCGPEVEEETQAALELERQEALTAQAESDAAPDIDSDETETPRARLRVSGQQPSAPPTVEAEPEAPPTNTVLHAQLAADYPAHRDEAWENQVRTCLSGANLAIEDGRMGGYRYSLGGFDTDGCAVAVHFDDGRELNCHIDTIKPFPIALAQAAGGCIEGS